MYSYVLFYVTVVPVGMVCLHLHRCGVHVPTQASPVPNGHQAVGCEVSCNAWAVVTFLKYITIIFVITWVQYQSSCSKCLCSSSQLLASPAPTSRLWGKLYRLGWLSLSLITLWSGTFYQFPYYKPFGLCSQATRQIGIASLWHGGHLLLLFYVPGRFCTIGKDLLQ